MSASKPNKRSRHAQLREAAKQETREALIRAATEVFSDKGLDASLDDICAAAGYTRGAFYVHFSNRDELAAAVMCRVGEGVLNTLLGPEDAAPVESLGELVAGFIQALLNGEYPLTRAGGVRPYQLLDACARSPQIRDQYMQCVHESISRLGEITRRLQDKGEIRNDISPQQLGFWLITLVIGLHTLHDLEMEIDFTGGIPSLLKLVKP